MKIKTLLVASLIVASANAMAWGQREQGALAGVIAGAVITEHQHRPVYPVYPTVQYSYPQPVYVQPVQPQQICGYNVYCGPTSCYNQPMYDQYGRFLGYQQICR